MIWRQRDYRYRDIEDPMMRTTVPQQKRIREVGWPACGAHRTLLLSTLLRVVDESICWAMWVDEASSLLVSRLGTLFGAGSTTKAKSNDSISTPK